MLWLRVRVGALSIVGINYCGLSGISVGFLANLVYPLVGKLDTREQMVIMGWLCVAFKYRECNAMREIEHDLFCQLLSGCVAKPQISILRRFP